MTKRTKRLLTVTTFFLTGLVVFSLTAEFRALYYIIIANNSENPIPSLIAGLQDRSELVRKVIVNSLSAAGEKAIPYLAAAMDNNNPSIRQGSAFVLGRMAIQKKVDLGKLNLDAGPVLKKGLLDPDEKVRATAAFSLWNIEKNEGRILEVLIASLDSLDLEVKYLACTVLEEMGPKGLPALPKLQFLSKSQEENVRTWANSAIKAISQK